MKIRNAIPVLTETELVNKNDALKEMHTLLKE